MPKRRESLSDLLIRSPWWVSLLLGGTVLTLLSSIPAGFGNGNPVLEGASRALPKVAPFLVLLFLVLSLMSAPHRLKCRWLENTHTSLESLRAMPWKDFEHFFCPATTSKGGSEDRGSLRLWKDSPTMAVGWTRKGQEKAKSQSKSLETL